jgi:ABC-type phosphate/phosphonate transport system ATPase subunit
MIMSDEIVKRVLETVKAVSQDRHKLVILLGVFGSGKTKILKRIEVESDAVYVNLNLELSERFLQLPASKVGDGVTVHAIIGDICDQFSQGGKTVLIDNVELLFSPELSKINPVDTFKRMSRERPVVLALPAVRQGNLAIYSTPNSADYFTIPLEDFVVIEIKKD